MKRCKDCIYCNEDKMFGGEFNKCIRKNSKYIFCSTIRTGGWLISLLMGGLCGKRGRHFKSKGVKK